MPFALAFLAAAALPAAAPCKVLIAAKSAGEAVYAEDTAAAACPVQQPRGVLRYSSQRHCAVARVDLVSGTDLGIAYLPKRPAISAGDRLLVTAAIGHAVVSRSVTALQNAASGKRFFVRADDGSIFAAPPLRGTQDGQEAQR